MATSRWASRALFVAALATVIAALALILGGPAADKAGAESFAICDLSVGPPSDSLPALSVLILRRQACQDELMVSLQTAANDLEDEHPELDSIAPLQSALSSLAGKMEPFRSFVTDPQTDEEILHASLLAVLADVIAVRLVLDLLGDDAQLAGVDLQNILQKQQQTLQMMSNISKAVYDTAMSVIRKLGGG